MASCKKTKKQKKTHFIPLEMETQARPSTIGLRVFPVVVLAAVVGCLQAFLGFPGLIFTSRW